MNRNAWAAIIATAAVVVVLCLGFRFFGSPSYQRLVRADARDVQALAALAQQINFLWNQSQKTLPGNLDRITVITKKSFLTGRPFVYHPEQSGAYELCTTFATDNRQAPDTNTVDPWVHPKGDYCFQLDATQPVPSVPYYSYY